LTTSSADAAARRAARAVRESLRGAPGGEPNWAALDLLVEMAAHSDGELFRTGMRELFGTVIEPLNDTHREELRPVYNRLFAHIIQRVRRSPAAHDLDQLLATHGACTDADFIAHAEQVSRPRPFPMAEGHRLRRIFLLSSVTIGRDIAVNVPAMQHLRRAFPGAEIVFLADPTLGTLFEEDRGVRIHPVAYPRRGRLVQLLLSYVTLESAIRQEIDGLAADDFLIVGMDSRLDQLMLLPLTAQDRQRYYGWRNTLPESELRSGAVSLAAQAAGWLQDTFPTDPYPLRPVLRTTEANRRFAETLYHSRGLADALVVTMNLGVGGNDRKRVGEEFELAVIRGLVGAGSKVLLSVAPDSESLAAGLRRRLEADGIAVGDPHDRHPRPAGAAPPAVLIARGTLGQTAALIERSRLYVGYDSMAHHMAAALGQDVIAVFAGYDTPYFPDRWCPNGTGTVRLIRGGSGPFTAGGQSALATQVLAAFQSLQRSA
jgi:hypothetical protein